MDKTINNYAKIYRKVLSQIKVENIDAEIDSYKKRLGEMYSSENFKKYSVYPTTNVVHVFAVIAMCLGLKCFNMSDIEIIKNVRLYF